MAEFNNFYQRAVYYDIVFSRDVTCEIDFVAAVYRQLVGREPAALLDLACGPGYHARAFAARGGRAVGLDLREEMLALAASCAAAEGVQVEWIAADMRSLRLEQPVDVALNVFDGIDCLHSTQDLVAHMRAIAANLTPQGLYIIDVTHPRYTTFNHYEPFCYAGQRDGVTVRIDWATNHPVVDPLTSTVVTQIEMHVDDHGQQFVIVDTACERVLSAQEITLLAELSGVLRPVAWYGAYDMGQPLDSSSGAQRMIALLQKIDG